MPAPMNGMPWRPLALARGVLLAALSGLTGLGGLGGLAVAPAVAAENGGAQDRAAVATAVTAAPDATPLFQSLGGRDGVHRLTDDFVHRVTTDPRIEAQFRETNLKRLREKLEEQLCQVSGGGCTYSGDPMFEVHKGLHVSAADFNALVEDLQSAMDAQGIPFHRQNALLALLAPMHRDIIQRREKP